MVVGEKELMIPKIFIAPSPQSVAAAVGSRPQVFLLHFHRQGSEHYQKLREWVHAITKEVDDIDDEEADEDINQDPEGWVMSRLASKEVRVVLMAGKFLTKLLNTSSDSESDDNNGEVSRLELRTFALKHIQSHFSGNYRQLVVVSFDKYGSDGEAAAGLLTPNKGPLVLPHHLSDLHRWLNSDLA